MYSVLSSMSSIDEFNDQTTGRWRIRTRNVKGFSQMRLLLSESDPASENPPSPSPNLPPPARPGTEIEDRLRGLFGIL